MFMALGPIKSLFKGVGSKLDRLNDWLYDQLCAAVDTMLQVLNAATFWIQERFAAMLLWRVDDAKHKPWVKFLKISVMLALVVSLASLFVELLSTLAATAAYMTLSAIGAFCAIALPAIALTSLAAVCVSGIDLSLHAIQRYIKTPLLKSNANSETANRLAKRLELLIEKRDDNRLDTSERKELDALLASAASSA